MLKRVSPALAEFIRRPQAEYQIGAYLQATLSTEFCQIPFSQFSQPPLNLNPVVYYSQFVTILHQCYVAPQSLQGILV
jgi:hypothetical protein